MTEMRLSNPSPMFVRHPFRKKTLALGVALALVHGVHAPVALANPTGMSVVAGQATAQTLGNLLQITNSPGAILNWQQFNIDVGQTTQFIQQNAGSQVFNRVTGGDVSQILGTLKSNGQVFLINPAGVFFGQGAVVDTAGFLASSLAASNADLLNGHLKFSSDGESAGGIVNRGTLTSHSGGSVVLLAPSIENSGLIHADGEVLLAAGHSVTIVDMKHPTIGLSVSVKEGDKALNLGEMIGKNVSFFASLLTNSGVVQATNVELGQGGVIRFVGDHVKVSSGSVTSADGTHGGGKVHIGGGWQGRDAATPNAKTTDIQADAKVSASATVNGHGGEVVAWSDGATSVQSSLQAKGGALGGNGGRVETSGKQWLSVGKAANTSAPKGQAGKWLIDPANLTIVGQIPPNGQSLESLQQGPTEFTTANLSNPESFLLNSTVVQGLEDNNFVEIFTTGTAPGAGNLTVAAPILVSNDPEQFGTNPRLLLEAQGDININAALGLAAGQTAYQGFDLELSYDIAKPVNINAPLFLGNTGVLRLAPYSTDSMIPTTGVNQRPQSGVNLLAGMNTGVNGALGLNRIEFADAIATDPMTMAGLNVPNGSSLRLNVLGANLVVDDISAINSLSDVSLDLLVGLDPEGLLPATQGMLTYTNLNAGSLTVGMGGMVTALGDPMFSGAFSSVGTVNINGGTLNLNGGVLFADTLNLNSGAVNMIAQSFLDPDAGLISQGVGSIDNFNVLAGSTFNMTGTFMDYGFGVINGTINLNDSSQGVPALLSGFRTDLNGTLNLNSGANAAHLQSLRMGSSARVLLRAGTSLNLGRALSSSGRSPAAGIFDPNAYVSSSGGQFVAVQGAQIIMEGQLSDTMAGGPPPSQLPPLLQPSSSPTPGNDSFFGGAVIDLTGLNGRLDAPVDIQSTGYLNGILTSTSNQPFSGQDTAPPPPVPIVELAINAGSITVNAGGAGKALRFGEYAFQPSPSMPFVPTIGLDFNANLTVNSGNVRLDGSTISTINGNLTVNGGTALIGFNGKFTSADLFQVNRLNGGKLALAGDWDNSGVNANNVNTASPLSKGSLLVFDDLAVDGGVLSSAGTANTINVTSDGFLELRNLSTNATFNLDPEAAMMLAVQDDMGTPVAPAFLNGATINMAGNNILVVEAQANGVANLDGSATISSGVQGNLILAGRRLSSFSNAANIPDDMTLNIGNGIRLNVAGNAAVVPDGLQLFYNTQGIANPSARPVFLVGQLTPEAVAFLEYEDFGGLSTPMTTILNGFANPSFVIDGNPDSQISIPNCSPDFCVKFDVEQTVAYLGSVRSVLGQPSPSLANSGVVFAESTSLTSISYAFQGTDSLTFTQGLNIITSADLVGGKRLVNASGSIVRLGSNLANETIAGNIENNGTLELFGNYTFSGVFSGTGGINNAGTLVLNNTSGSTLTNPLNNTGSITNLGNYALSSSLAGGGTLVNQGTFAFAGSGSVIGNISNSGQLNFAMGRTVTGNVSSNGGVISGFATINGDLTLSQGARLTPGSSPGLMSVSGNFILDANSVVDIEVASNGGVPGVDYDFVSVGGTATLAGQLNLVDLSGGSLGSGNAYRFLEAGSITGAFAVVNKVNTGLAYTFSDPTVLNLGNNSALVTNTVVQVGSTVGSGSTGSTTTTPVTQNLQQAFVQPTTTTTNNNTGSSSGPASSPATPQEEQQAVEVANQSTAGTTVSQQSNDIELRSTSSDAPRPSAVCK